MLGRLLRWYLYARRGLGHVSVVLSGVTFVNTLYLVSRDWLLVGELGYVELMVLGVCVLVPLLVLLGYLDYRRGFFCVEASIATEENPYTTRLFTVKERELMLPLSLAVADYLVAPSEEKRLALEKAHGKLKSCLGGTGE